MKKIDTLITSKHIYTMEGDGVGYISDGAIAIDSSKIVAIGERASIEKEYSADKTYNLNNHAIFPGFIDAHMHTGLAIMRGLAQDTNNWMMHGLQPFDNAASSEARLAGSKLAIIEAIKAGTTLIGDYEYNMGPVCDFIGEVGARGNITSMIREAKRKVYAPGELYEFDEALGEKTLKENIELFDRYHNSYDNRIKILFGPQGPDFMSKDFLLRVRSEAIERGTKIHLHTQQGDRETYQIVNRYGKRPIDWLKSIDYLDENLIAVHLTDATDDEAKVVARSGASMILCPGSIGIIDGVVPPSVAFQEAGGSVALGSDQAPGNNCHNIINEMKLVCLFNKIKYTNPEAMPAYKALRMATIEGAKALGLDKEIGSLEVGKRADIIAIDLNQPSMLPIYSKPMRNIVPNLVYSARGEEVVFSMVNGSVIMENRKLLKIDEADIIKEVLKYPEVIGEKATNEFNSIKGTNYEFMNAGKL